MDNYNKLQRRIAEDKVMVYESFVANNINDKYKLEELAKKLKAIK